MIVIDEFVLPSQEQMMFIIQGMRNPMNSWEKSDSSFCNQDEDCTDCETDKCHGFYLGDNDYDLMQRLANAGSEHRKFMRMMPIGVRITAPLYFWKEFDTYKVGTVSNSCSTMHKIAAKEFSRSDFSTEHLSLNNLMVLSDTITQLNMYRELYLKWDSIECENRVNLGPVVNSKEDIWWQMIQLLPSSYNQTRNIMMNYEVLYNIYHQRRNHRLNEWLDFCVWVERLPYSELIVEKSTT